MVSSEDPTKPSGADTPGPSVGTKLPPRTTSRLLPWLDGKSSPNFVTPPSTPGEIGPPRRASQPSQTIRASRRSSRADPNPWTIGSTGRRLSAAAVDSPTTVVGTRSANARYPRTPHNKKVFSPLAEEPRPTQGPAPSTRRSSTVARVIAVDDPFSEAQPRKGSLAPVPAHLEGGSEPSTPDSDIIARPVPRIARAPSPVKTQPRRVSLGPTPAHLEQLLTPHASERPVPRSAFLASPPAILHSTELSPTQPVPQQPVAKRNPLESARDKRRISNAIEGLEDLVQEAVDIAEENPDQAQVQEVYEIIEDATNAIRDASVMPTQHLMATSSPLEVSSDSSEASSSSESSEEYANARTCSPERRRSAPRASHQPGPSVARDWAYEDTKAQPRRHSFVSASSDSDERPRARFASQNDLLIPPQQAQTAPRDRTDFVLRPATNRDHSRGRARRRRGTDSDLDARRHRHRRKNHDSPRRLKRKSPSDSPSGSSSEDEENVRPHHRSFRRGRDPQELSVRDQAHHHTFSLRRHHRRQPIARNWSTGKKRLTAMVACLNTALLGIIVGIYAGEVPRIQYVLADEQHHVIVGNVVLYFGLAISTFISWPLPLLHGRKPYILASLAIALPLQFPQAIVISARRSPTNAIFRTGLLVARALSGLVLGFANVNFVTVLLDLFGASLQSKNPHQEFVVVNDIRRHGGGMGMWLGVWSWCSIASLAIGFQIGAGIIENHTPDWGFYIVVIILAAAMIINILTPETRRSTYRRSVTEVYDRDENFITRRVARGEVKLHVGTEGPKYWFEEVWAGMKLTLMMMMQPGFAVLAFYTGWIYAQIVLVIILLGALLSRDYNWYPRFVGLGVMSIAIGALLAVPLTKAGIFSRERKNPFRTDSITFQNELTWSSHMVRRFAFMITLPLMGLAYTVSSAGRPQPYIVPIIFAGAVGFLSILAISECMGLIMETFDTSDLQPGVNTSHRLQSMAAQDRRRRTNYSSFPRVTAGFFASQTIAFVLAAIATQVGGIMTRRLGAQVSTGVTAGILLGLTILLTAALWRFKQVQVIPNHTFGTRRDSRAWQEFKEIGKDDWKAVVIGNPSGKMRKMSALELGGLSRWTEIRKLNFLIRDDKNKAKESSWRV